jgi:hypothetical protein
VSSQRIMTLSQAISVAQPLPGLYMLVRQGRSLYAGQSSNLRARMIHYNRMARLLGCDTTTLTVRLTYLRNANPEQRRRLEQSYIRRVKGRLNRVPVGTGRPRFINVQGNREY